jgi:hypothetical protein
MDNLSAEMNLRVAFQSLSGESHSVKVSRYITGLELHELAALMFCREVKLFLESLPLGKDWNQPLTAVQQSNIVVHTILHGGTTTCMDSLINLIRDRNFSSASLMLQRQPKLAHMRAVLRDSSDNTALAWAAYCSRRCPHPLDLINRLLNKAKHLVHVRCHGLRFLPLHEAAWGNAPPDVAVLLCAAYPAAVNAKANDGSTPHDVGRYHHANFAWPCVDKLVELARNLRMQIKQERSLKAVRRSVTVKPSLTLKPRFLDGAIVGCLGLPHFLAAQVADFVFDNPVLGKLNAHESRSEATSQALVGSSKSDNDIHMNSQNMPHVQHSDARSKRRHQLVYEAGVDMRRAGPGRQRPPRGRCSGVSTCLTRTCIEFVELNREAEIKERGQFAGFRRARHRKSTFQSLTEVTVGMTVHRLCAHTVHAVREKEIESKMRWPEKKLLFNFRTRDRDAKYEALLPT